MIAQGNVRGRWDSVGDPIAESVLLRAAGREAFRPTAAVPENYLQLNLSLGEEAPLPHPDEQGTDHKQR
jgi:hypothetical protein